MKVTIFHNETRDAQGRHIAMLDGFRPGHRLVEVFAYEIPEAGAPTHVAEEAFELFNIGDDPDFRPAGPDETAVAYRARRLRSLSVGDVVRAGDVALACASRGWDYIDPADLPAS